MVERYKIFDGKKFWALIRPEENYTKKQALNMARLQRKRGYYARVTPPYPGARYGYVIWVRRKD